MPGVLFVVLTSVALFMGSSGTGRADTGTHGDSVPGTVSTDTTVHGENMLTGLLREGGAPARGRSGRSGGSPTLGRLLELVRGRGQRRRATQKELVDELGVHWFPIRDRTLGLEAIGLLHIDRKNKAYRYSLTATAEKLLDAVGGLGGMRETNSELYRALVEAARLLADWSPLKTESDRTVASIVVRRAVMRLGGPVPALPSDRPVGRTSTSSLRKLVELLRKSGEATRRQLLKHLEADPLAVATRLEGLEAIGLVNIDRRWGGWRYSLTVVGQRLLEALGGLAAVRETNPRLHQALTDVVDFLDGWPTIKRVQDRAAALVKVQRALELLGVQEPIRNRDPREARRAAVSLWKLPELVQGYEGATREMVLKALDGPGQTAVNARLEGLTTLGLLTWDLRRDRERPAKWYVLTQGGADLYQAVVDRESIRRSRPRAAAMLDELASFLGGWPAFMNNEEVGKPGSSSRVPRSR